MSSTRYNYFHDFASFENNSMKLNETSISKFKIAKQFNDNEKRINSIDISLEGTHLITSSDDDTIFLYDCIQGTKSKGPIFSKKYGVDLIRFTHASNTAVHTSTKENDIIRYLSLHDNKYLRYFKGHEKRVVTLSMSPANDEFISASLDHTLRIWDLRQDGQIGRLEGLNSPLANYDPEGLIFAVGTDDEYIKLYDARLYDKGPFNTVHMAKTPGVDRKWKSLQFSPNGKQILLTTDYEELHLLDAFSLQPIQKLTHERQLASPIENPCAASYTPDSQFILYGSLDGCVHVWSGPKGIKVTTLRPEKNSFDSVNCVAFNPKYMLMATASNKVSFWIPTMDEIL